MYIAKSQSLARQIHIWERDHGQSKWMGAYLFRAVHILATCGRQYGLANGQYTEHATERLSLSRQSIQSLLGPISRSRSPALRRSPVLHYYLGR